MSRVSESSIANLVWKLTALANRTVTVTTNNDKTGYSLTAGSYSIRASSVQRAVVSVTGANATNTAVISSVTVTRAPEHFTGFASDDPGTGNLTYFGRIALASATTVSITRIQAGGGASTSYGGFAVPEYV